MRATTIITTYGCCSPFAPQRRCINTKLASRIVTTGIYVFAVDPNHVVVAFCGSCDDNARISSMGTPAMV